ncbi:MAG: acylphosphatase [bacterium]
MEARVKIIVKGLVQGVGYRYFCSKMAQEFNINGYAKNLADGSVEIEAVGSKSMMNEFISALKRGPVNSNVKLISVEDLPYEEKFTGFRIY